MKNKETLSGHLLALITVIIWGTTFISTKVLLGVYDPMQILFIRFLIGYIVLWAIYPKWLKIDLKQELLYLGAGISGLTLYYLCENIALVTSYTSSVSVIVATAPFFTGILAHFVLKEKAGVSFFIGFAIAIAGVALISFNGAAVMNFSSKGDILSLIAAITWAFYSIFTKKASNKEVNIIMATRRIFFYGLITMLPVLWCSGTNITFAPMREFSVAFNMLFLGVLASGICFVTWNRSIRILGAMSASVYIYLVPLVTLVFSVLVLKEQVTFYSALGTVLVLAGLIISKTKKAVKRKNICAISSRNGGE